MNHFIASSNGVVPALLRYCESKAFKVTFLSDKNSKSIRPKWQLGLKLLHDGYVAIFKFTKI